MRVASGLDSMVLGEPQILGQLKQAYGLARREGSLGVVLDKLFQRSFSVAKRVRTDTDIGSSPVSVAYAAVTLATGSSGISGFAPRCSSAPARPSSSARVTSHRAVSDAW